MQPTRNVHPLFPSRLTRGLNCLCLCNTDLTSANYDFAYDKTHNVRPRRNIRAAMAKEISMYAVAQKDKMGMHQPPETRTASVSVYRISFTRFRLLLLCLCMCVSGLDKAVEDSKYAMRRYGVTPNLLVIPPQLSLYMALAPEEKLTCVLSQSTI